MYCLQAHLCIIQPGNVAGWGSEGVKPRAKLATKYRALNIIMARSEFCSDLDDLIKYHDALIF